VKGVFMRIERVTGLILAVLLMTGARMLWA
jgi:hypothetical protein